jgi:iron complex transport system substrate-binding protein
MKDMLGRNVILPSEINRVYSITYSTNVLLYMLAPEKMIGWDQQRTTDENQYLPNKYRDLPVLGGGKEDANYESILSENPDVVFVGHGKTIENMNNIQQKLGPVPLLDVEGDNNITNITPSIQFMGQILGENDRATKLITFQQNVLTNVSNTVDKIKPSERKKVYYARDATGLKTNPSGSSHTQLIDLCGGTNVVQVPLTKGSSTVSMEMILDTNPDIIIASNPQFYKNVYSDPLWQNVKAVKNKEVYLVPQSPFNWFEGPPGANTIIGIAWTARVLYPDKFSAMNLKNLTKDFYADFYHYNLTDGEVNSILNSSGLK